jgi:DNA modification methylase
VSGDELMTPYYQDGAVTIYHGDCREIMPALSGVDLVLTDPPYGIGLIYGEETRDSTEVFKEILQLLTEWPLPTAFTLPSTRLFDLPLRPDWIGVWHKPMAMGFWNTLFYPHWEAICFYRFEGKLERDDVWVANTEKPNGHPTPKPLNLWKPLLSCLPGETTLDPFMGSGTTLRAAKDLGRKAIGIEIEERYCEIAANRMAQSVMELA